MSISARSNGPRVRLAGAALMALAILGPASATPAPAILRESQSIMIDAPIGDVWAIAGQFSDMTWVPGVRSSTATDNNKPRSHRTLDLGGAQMTETLKRYSAARHAYTYVIDDTDANHKIAPVSDVTARISVASGASGSSVLTWSATFHRLDHGAAPAAGADDAAAEKQINSIFALGLSGAKKKVEAR